MTNNLTPPPPPVDHLATIRDIFDTGTNSDGWDIGIMEAVTEYLERHGYKSSVDERGNPLNIVERTVAAYLGAVTGNEARGSVIACLSDRSTEAEIGYELADEAQLLAGYDLDLDAEQIEAMIGLTVYGMLSE